MRVAHKWTQIWGLALPNYLTIARKFFVTKHTLFVHLWGTTMWGLIAMANELYFGFYDDDYDDDDDDDGASGGGDGRRRRLGWWLAPGYGISRSPVGLILRIFYTRSIIYDLSQWTSHSNLTSSALLSLRLQAFLVIWVQQWINTCDVFYSSFPCTKCYDILYAATYDFSHYIDVIMTTMTSQITSLTAVYSIVYSDADQRKHQSSTSLAFMRWIHRGPVNSPHKWPVTRKMFPFADILMSHHFSLYQLAVWSR